MSVITHLNPVASAFYTYLNQKKRVTDPRGGYSINIESILIKNVKYSSITEAVITYQKPARQKEYN